MNFLYLSTGDLWPCYISFKLPSSNEFLSINLMVFFLFPLSNFLNFFDLVENNVSSLTLQFDGKNIHVMRKFPILPSGRPRMASPGGPKTKQDENLPIRNINLKEYGTTQSIHTLASAWVRIYNLGAPLCTIVPPLNSFRSKNSVN